LSVFFKQSPAAHRIHLPAGQRTSTHIAQRRKLTGGQLFKVYYKRPMAFKFTKCKLGGLSRVLCNVGAYRKLKKANNNRETQGIASGYLEQPTTRTDRQDCESLLKLSDWRLVLELGAVGGHFEHSQWQWYFGIWSLVNCVVDLFQRCYWTGVVA